jgi:hypothetical protein
MDFLGQYPTMQAAEEAIYGYIEAGWLRRAQDRL